MEKVKKIVVGFAFLLLFGLVLLLVDYIRLNLFYSLHKSEYKSAFKVYGNTSKYVPQGMTFVEDKNIVLQTSYNGDGNVSRLYVVDFSTGKLMKSLKLRDENHKNSSRHVGGVASDGVNVWVTSDYEISRYSFEEIVSTENDYIDSLEDAELPIRGDFSTYHDGILWIGDFYLKPFYDVPDGNPLLMAYPVVDAMNYSKPDVVISLPKMVQGLTFNEKGEFVLTSSFTYLIQSEFRIYENVLKKEAKETIQIGNKKIAYYQFNKQNLVMKKKIPPMAEGLFYFDGSYYILFESSTDYYPLALPRIKNVIELKIDKK